MESTSPLGPDQGNREIMDTDNQDDILDLSLTSMGSHSEAVQALRKYLLRKMSSEG